MARSDGALVILAPLAAWLAPEHAGRLRPDAGGRRRDDVGVIDAKNPQGDARRGPLASRSTSIPAFWVFALATSVYGLAYSGIGLFNEAILRELGFNAETYHATLAGAALAGLVSQMVAGWLGWRWSLRGVLALALAIYAASLVWLPHVDGLGALWANTVLMGAAGGMITVVFFAIWPATFGRAHLGRIQGAAQMLTVFSSALGPVLFAECQARTGSYALALYALTPCALALAVATCLVRVLEGAAPIIGRLCSPRLSFPTADCRASYHTRQEGEIWARHLHRVLSSLARNDMHFPIRKNVKISELPRSSPPTEIRPNNPNPSEPRDPRPGRYSIVGAVHQAP